MSSGPPRRGVQQATGEAALTLRGKVKVADVHRSMGAIGQDERKQDTGPQSS